MTFGKGPTGPTGPDARLALAAVKGPRRPFTLVRCP
jgi:hypothetical protein